MSKFVRAIAPLPVLRRCPVRNTAGTQTVLIQGIRGYPHYWKANSGIVPQIRTGAAYRDDFYDFTQSL